MQLNTNTTDTVKSSQLQAAVDKLLQLEKQTRQASDLASTSRLIVAIVTLCKEAGDWSLLNEQVLLLSKKHGQLKQAITKMVQVVMEFLPDAPSQDVKLSTIETLRTVTEGKVWSLQLDNDFTDIYRSSLKSSEHESHASFQTSRSSKMTSQQHETSFANFKLRRLAR